MQGLRTQESNKFLKFFKIVQAEAGKNGAVFFLDCGMGRVFENEEIECEDLCGWVIPNDVVTQFEPLFMSGSGEQHLFDRFYCFADFEITGGAVNINISQNH